MVDKRKMATGGGENETNVRTLKEKKEPRVEKERTDEERNEDIEHVLEMQRGLFRGHLRSSL